ncbi:MAG: thiamine-binding protein [Chitinophagaceae bacterium]|nr:thiamine-binding protein [Chitinophagaceae bacterium]
MDNHSHIISASLQLVPIIPGAKHPYDWIDEVIAIIKASGLQYEVGPFSTSVESDYKSVMCLIDSINSFLFAQDCPEWLLQVQLQLRSGADMTSHEKTDKHRD